MAQWTSAYVNDLPDSSFLYIEPGGSKDSDGRTTPRSLRHFPVKDAEGNIDMPHLRNALSRIPQSNLPQSVKDRLTSKAQGMMPSQNSASGDGSELRYAPAVNADLELRDGSGEMPVLAGHFAVFDEWTHIASRYEGDFLERIAPGAFAKTLSENRKNMRVLFNHGKDALGEQILGSINELREDERGAYYEVGLYDGVPPLILNGLRDGQYGSSFRFRVVKEEKEYRPEPSDYNPDGLPERTIQEAKVMEFGPVTFPAYEGASAGLRSATDWWWEQNLVSALEVLTGTRAAALESEPEPEPEPDPPEDEPVPAASRSTRSRDYLRPRKERRSWELP